MSELTCLVVECDEAEVEDRSLVRDLARGDGRAFNGLVARYMVPVYRFTKRLVGSVEDAEDLTQETFRVLYEHRRELNPEASISSYLFTVARRKAISLIRWRKVRRIVRPLSREDECAIPDSSASPVDFTRLRQTEEAVDRALQCLSPKKRAALLLRFFEGLTYGQIARVMNAPEGTVKAWVSRGERELRRRLPNWEDW